MLRRDNQVLIHSLSKYTALVEDFSATPKVIYQGQENATVSLYSSKKTSALKVNGVSKNGRFDSSNKIVKVTLK